MALHMLYTTRFGCFCDGNKIDRFVEKLCVCVCVCGGGGGGGGGGGQSPVWMIDM